MVVLVLSLALVGCGYSMADCYNSVVEAYPNSEVRMIPGENWRFIVKQPDGTILYVETMNTTNTNVTQEFAVFKGEGK